MKEVDNLTRVLGNYAGEEKLILRGLGITDDQIKNILIPFLVKNDNITHLDLSDNEIGDEGAKEFAENTTIVNLNLSCNNIRAEGAKGLAKNTTITDLDLSYNYIGINGAAALAANPTFTNLNLGCYGDNEIYDDISVLIEKDPHKRAENALNPDLGGMPPEAVPIPSLKRLSLFAVKNNPDLLQQAPRELNLDLKKALLKPKV